MNGDEGRGRQGDRGMGRRGDGETRGRGDRGIKKRSLNRESGWTYGIVYRSHCAITPFLLALRLIFIKEANGHSSQWYQVNR